MHRLDTLAIGPSCRISGIDNRLCHFSPTLTESEPENTAQLRLVRQYPAIAKLDTVPIRPIYPTKQNTSFH